MLKKSIGILGAGAFGTALAIAYHKCFDVTLFSCFEKHVAEMKQTRVNEFFPEFKIPDSIAIDVTENLQNYKFDYVFWVFPITPTSEILNNIKNLINAGTIVVCSKGILPNTEFLYDLFKNTFPNSDISYLAGPNFAIELANNKFSAADIAALDLAKSREIANDLSTDNFKLNPIDDVIGAQICGALKNIIALGSGIINGLELGHNTYTAYLTLALAEMKRLGLALGAKEETFYGLCGLGDLMLTTSSLESRNTKLGFEIAKGKNINELITNRTTCEGYSTLQQVLNLAGIKELDLKICHTIYTIICESVPPKEILNVFR